MDEHWLDNEANTIDEQHIIYALESSSDYERGLGCLDEQGKATVKKLREWAGDIAKAAGNNENLCLHCSQESSVTDVSWEGSDHEKEPKAVKKKADKSVNTPIFTKKENATLAQRIEVLNWHHKNGKNQSKTARHFDKIYPNLRMKQPLVSTWLKEEQKWGVIWEETDHKSNRTAKRTRQTEHPEVSEMMSLWVSKAMGDGILLTGDVLRNKWNPKFADLVGIPEDEWLNLSNGWLGRFKDRTGLKELRRHGEAASANANTVENERKRVQELIKKYGYQLRDIFNMDETGLFYKYALSLPIFWALFDFSL